MELPEEEFQEALREYDKMEIMCMVCGKSLSLPYYLVDKAACKWVHEGCSTHVNPILLEGARKIERPKPTENREGAYMKRVIMPHDYSKWDI